MKNNKIQFNEKYGIYAEYTRNKTFFNNIISDNYYGVWLRNSCLKNNVLNNIIRSNEFGGILLSSFCKENVVKGNIITNNSDSIHLDFSNKNVITMNIIEKTGICLDLYESSFNLIEKNNFMDNFQYILFIDSFFNRWNNNYWGRARLTPKLLIGLIVVIEGEYHPWEPPKPGLIVPWFNFDWNPAIRPFDITTKI